MIFNKTTRINPDGSIDIDYTRYSDPISWLCPSCGMPQTGLDLGICDPCKAIETADPNSEYDSEGEEE